MILSDNDDHSMIIAAAGKADVGRARRYHSASDATHPITFALSKKTCGQPINIAFATLPMFALLQSEK